MNHIPNTIFLIEEDDCGRPALRKLLKQEGYNLTLAIDEEDALERVGNHFIKADLMLISLLKKSVKEALRIGRSISEIGKFQIPIVVLPKKYGEDLEGRDVRDGDNDYITYTEDGQQLLDLLFRLTEQGRKR
jgi:PleD family two-component response regulator